MIKKTMQKRKAPKIDKIISRSNAEMFKASKMLKLKMSFSGRGVVGSDVLSTGALLAEPTWGTKPSL